MVERRALFESHSQSAAVDLVSITQGLLVAECLDCGLRSSTVVYPRFAISPAGVVLDFVW
jgi:hypothetical protein